MHNSFGMMALWLTREEECGGESSASTLTRRGTGLQNSSAATLSTVRHDPPWQVRPWIRTQEGRAAMVGTNLDCWRCAEQA
jgi:hypothetical protein